MSLAGASPSHAKRDSSRALRDSWRATRQSIRMLTPALFGEGHAPSGSEPRSLIFTPGQSVPHDYTKARPEIGTFLPRNPLMLYPASQRHTPSWCQPIRPTTTHSWVARSSLLGCVFTTRQPRNRRVGGVPRSYWRAFRPPEPDAVPPACTGTGVLCGPVGPFFHVLVVTRPLWKVISA
jgi:hypothetical protein